MTRDELIAFCLAKPGAEETYPWGDADLVVKVGGKAFAFIGLSEPGGVSLKCGANADEAGQWRERYPGVISVSASIGRYDWNRVELTGAVPAGELVEMVDASYAQVVCRLPKGRIPSTQRLSAPFCVSMSGKTREASLSATIC